jgi:hypothetical protein
MNQTSSIDKVIDLCKKYNIEPTHKNVIGDATGIGDILFHMLCVKNNLVTEPFTINLSNFAKPYYNTDPIMQLEFRLKLLMDLLKFNNININMLNFVFSNVEYINQKLPYNDINNFKLNIDEVIPTTNTNPYIIFHTKCRHNSTEDYTLIKSKMRFFFGNFKSKYKIYIMGERTFPINHESMIHGITTIYNELLELKNNNTLIDISIEDIYCDLDYNNYKQDVILIKNARHNICFGIGGQLCTSLILGNSTIFYTKIDLDVNGEYLANNNHFHCKTIESCFEFINNTSSA